MEVLLKCAVFAGFRANRVSVFTTTEIEQIKHKFTVKIKDTSEMSWREIVGLD